MKAILAPVGTRGDVQPMLALGVELQRAGHEVTLVELSAVTDETPPWWDERRLLGLYADDSEKPL